MGLSLLRSQLSTDPTDNMVACWQGKAKRAAKPRVRRKPGDPPGKRGRPRVDQDARLGKICEVGRRATVTPAGPLDGSCRSPLRMQDWSTEMQRLMEHDLDRSHAVPEAAPAAEAAQVQPLSAAQQRLLLAQVEEELACEVWQVGTRPKPHQLLSEVCVHT